MERKQSKQPLQGTFSILSQFSTGNAYLSSEQQRTILGVRHSSSSVLSVAHGKNKGASGAHTGHGHPIGKINEAGSGSHNGGGRLSPASSASTLKEPSDKGKVTLERRHAYDSISTHSDPENTSIIPSDTGKLLFGEPNSGNNGTSKNKKKSSSPIKGRIESNLNSIRENDRDRNDRDKESHLNRASIKNMLNINSDHSAIAASFKQSLTSLKSGAKTADHSHSNFKSKIHKSKKKNVVMVDCASQTDFPWTEEDEKREKKRRKRERAEMRKQMYLMKAESQENILGQNPSLKTPERVPMVSTKNKSRDSSQKKVHPMGGGQANHNYHHDREETAELRSGILVKNLARP